MITSIIFDFDGVILDSVHIKTDVFLHVFRHSTNIIKEKIVDLHLSNGGMPRSEKFKIIYEKYLLKELTPQELQRIKLEFSKVCFEKMLNASYIKGAYEFISERYAKFNLYIASGSPEGELREIVARRSIARYFKGVYGFPSNKISICRMIMQEAKLLPENVVFIGDAMSDWNAAKACGLNFIARLDDNDNTPLSKEQSFLKQRDLTKLDSILHAFSRPVG